MKKLLLMILPIYWLGAGFSQNSNPSVLSSAGETFQGTNIQLDWTLGELAITTIQNSDQLITQGFHQPDFLISAIEALPNSVGRIKVFPIPTDDWLSVNLDFDDYREVEMYLTNYLGENIWIKKIAGKQWVEKYSMATLSNGIYFLQIFIDRNKYYQTFKIQKIK